MVNRERREGSWLYAQKRSKVIDRCLGYVGRCTEPGIHASFIGATALRSDTGVARAVRRAERGFGL